MDDEILSQVRMCAACPKMCRHVCPTFFAWRSDSPTPHGRALLLHLEGKEIRDLDERAIDVLYQCLECSHCLTWCKPEIDIATIVETKRRELVKESREPQDIKDLSESLLKNHNPFNEPHEDRMTKLNIEAKDNPDILYFVGCTSSYREIEIANSTISVLKELGYNVAVLEDEWCCGSPLFRTGSTKTAVEQAEHNLEQLNSHEAKEIVVSCPGCFRSLTKDYPEHDLELSKSIHHISEFLDRHKDDIQPSEVTSRITYHDPCHLGRHCGIYEEPRSVIEHITRTPLHEMERNRDNAMCCGNGAGLRMMYPVKAKKIGSERITQAKQTDADLLLSSCPFCKNMLKQQAGDSIEVLDLIEFVHRHQKDDN